MAKDVLIPQELFTDAGMKVTERVRVTNENAAECYIYLRALRNGLAVDMKRTLRNANQSEVVDFGGIHLCLASPEQVDVLMWALDAGLLLLGTENNRSRYRQNS